MRHVKCLLLRAHEGKHPARAARAVDDLERRRDQDRAFRRQLVEIRQAREPEFVAAMHAAVARKRRLEAKRLSGVGADAFGSPADDVACRLARKWNQIRMRARARGSRLPSCSRKQLGPCASTNPCASAPTSRPRCGRAWAPSLRHVSASAENRDSPRLPSKHRSRTRAR